MHAPKRLSAHLHMALSSVDNLLFFCFGSSVILETTSNEITGGLYLVYGRSTLALSSALVHQTKQLQQKHHSTKQDQTIQTHYPTIFLL